MRNHVVALLAVFAALPFQATESMTLKGFQTELDKPWHDVVIRRFYGPWSIVRKKNGVEYADYNDYGAHSVQDLHFDSAEVTHDGSPTYLNDFPSNHDTRILEFDPGYGFNSVGLAVFSQGIRTGDLRKDMNDNKSENTENNSGDSNETTTTSDD